MSVVEKARKNIPVTRDQPILIKKNVELVHTSGHLGLLELKIVNILLFNAYDQLGKQRTHSMPYHYFVHLLRYEKSNNIAYLREALQKIISTVIEFDLLGDGERAAGSKKVPIKMSAILSSAVIEDGMCTYEYSSLLEEKLADPDIFGVFNLSLETSFQSAYAFRLYENVFRFINTNSRSTGLLTLDKVKRLLGAFDPSYSSFKVFNQKVLQPAIREVNSLLDGDFIQMEVKREARFISQIKFRILKHPQVSIFTPPSMDEAEAVRSTPLYKKMIEHGLADRLVVHWIMAEPERIESIVDHVEHQFKNGKIKSSTAGLIKNLIENKDAVVGKTKAQQRIENEKKLQQQQEMAKVLDSDPIASARTQDTRAKIKQLPREELAKFMAKFARESCAKSFNQETLQFKDVVERTAFTGWLYQHFASN